MLVYHGEQYYVEVIQDKDHVILVDDVTFEEEEGEQEGGDQDFFHNKEKPDDEKRLDSEEKLDDEGKLDIDLARIEEGSVEYQVVLQSLAAVFHSNLLQHALYELLEKSSVAVVHDLHLFELGVYAQESYNLKTIT